MSASFVAQTATNFHVTEENQQQLNFPMPLIAFYTIDTIDQLLDKILKTPTPSLLGDIYYTNLTLVQRLPAVPLPCGPHRTVTARAQPTRQATSSENQLIMQHCAVLGDN